MYSGSSLMLYVHYCKLLILWICLILPKGYTTMIFSLRPKSESIESVNFLRRIGPQTNVMPKSFTLGGFSHSAVQFRAKIKVLLIKQNLWLFSITNEMYVCHLATIRRTRLSCYWVRKSLHTQTKGQFLRWITVCQKVPKSYFRSQFWMSKINRIFSKKKLSKNINLGDHYLLKTFFF